MHASKPNTGYHRQTPAALRRAQEAGRLRGYLTGQGKLLSLSGRRDANTAPSRAVPCTRPANGCSCRHDGGLPGLSYKNTPEFSLRSIFINYTSFNGLILTPGPMVGAIVTLLKYCPFKVDGFALLMAPISVWKLSANCSSVKEAFPIGT